MRATTALPKDEACTSRFMTTVTGPTHHYQGVMLVEIYESGIYCRWEEDLDEGWYAVSWWELAHFAHATPPKLRDELDEMRDDAKAQGMREAIADFKVNPALWMDERKPPARS